MTRLAFIALVLQLRDEFEGSITSYQRTAKRNTAVGGHPQSRHLTGYGCDVVLDEMTLERKAAFAKEAAALGLRVIDESDHLHIQPSGPFGRPA